MRKIYINGEPLTLKKRVDSELSQIKPGSNKWRKLVKITGILLFVGTQTVWAGGVDALGHKAYEMLLDIASWYAIIACGIDLLKCGLNGTTHNISKVLVNYTLMYAAIASLPWIIDVIKGVLVK